MLKRVMTRSFVVFFVWQNRKTLQGNSSVQCVRKFLVAKKFVDKKREYQDFPCNIFRLTVPINFVGGPFSVSLISGIKNFYAYEGYDTVSVVFFVSQNQKTLQDDPSVVCFRKLPGAKKLTDKQGEGSIKILRRKILSHSDEKCRRGTLQSFINFGYRKKLDEKVGGGGG